MDKTLTSSHLFIDQKKIRHLAGKYRLRLVVLFGSQVTKAPDEESDIDIAFYPIGNIDEEKLYDDFIQVLRRADLDLINLATTHNHLLRYEILSKGQTLFEAESGIRSTMEWESFIDFTDFQPYYDLRRTLLDQKIAELTA